MDGYIAFLDLLGFSRFVARDTFNKTVDAYFTIVDESVDAQSSQVIFAIASDSIILTTTGDTLSHLRALLVTVSRITYRSLMDLGLPIRGGISFGNFERKPKGEAGTLVAGRGVVAAYELEQLQNWVGVMLSPALVERHPELQDYFDLAPIGSERLADDRREAGHADWLLLAVRYGQIPLQQDDDYLTGYVVVPRTGRPISDARRVISELRGFQAKLSELEPRALDVKAQRKYAYAGTFIQYVGRELYEFSSTNPPDFERFVRDLSR